MRAHRAAQHVEGALGVAHPVPKGLVDGRTEGGVAGGDRNHLGPHHPHASHVRSLPLHVDRSHVHDAGHAQAGAGGRGGHAVLAGPRLRHDALRPHALGEELLPQGVVDLVGAGVGEVLPLQPDVRTPGLAEAPGVGQGRGAADPRGELLVEGAGEAAAVHGLAGLGLQARQRTHQRLGHVPPTPAAIAARASGNAPPISSSSKAPPRAALCTR